MNYASCDTMLSKKTMMIAPILLRIIAGLGFFIHGWGKLFATPGIEGFTNMLTGLSVPAAGFFAVLVGVLELAGGLFLILGLFTRISALVSAIIMVFSTILVKIGNGWLAVLEPDILYIAVFITIIATGPGKYALDNILFKKKS